MKTIKLFDLFGEIQIKDDKASSSLDKIDGKAEKTSGRFDKMKDVTKKAGKVMAVGVGVAATALVGMAKKAADAGDEIHKGSQRMGISTDAYQELDYWAGQNGLSSENLEKGVGRLNSRMGEAAAGNDKYANALEKLGVPMDEVKAGTITTEEAFATSIQTLSGMSNEQEKAALASELFGKKLGRELLPSLNDGSLSIEEATEKAHEMGIIMGEDAVNGAADLTDMMDNATRSFGAIFRQIGEKVMPIMLEFLDWVVAHMPQIQEVIGRVMDAVVVAVDKGVEVFRDYLLPVFKIVKDWTVENWPLIQEVIGGVFEGIKSVWTNVLKPTLKVLLDVLMTVLGWVVDNWPSISDTFSTVFGIIKGVWNGVLKPVMDTLWSLFKSIASWVSNNWPTISSVFSTVFDAISSVWNNVLKPPLDFMLELLGKIVSYVSNNIDGMQGTFSSVFGAISGTVESLTGVFSTLSDGIKSAYDWLTSWNNKKMVNKSSTVTTTYNENRNRGTSTAGGRSSRRGGGARWNAKGGIFNRPTLFNTANAGMQGVGEAGSEAIIPLSKGVLGGIGAGIASTMSGGQGMNVNVNIKEFNNQTDEDVEKLSERLAFEVQRKLAGEGIGIV